MDVTELRQLRHRLVEQSAALTAARVEAEAHFQDLIEQYREEAGNAVRQGIKQLASNLASASGNDPVCQEILTAASDYLQWMTWTLWDLPYYAVAIRPDLDAFRERLSGVSLIYFSGRILDDFFDRHYLYREQRDTLLSMLAERKSSRTEAEAFTVIAALLVCFEGLDQLESAGASEVLRKVLRSSRRLLTGILMERSPRENWNNDFYDRLVELKNVDYWRILYAALDPSFSSPLYPFLSHYYALAQKLNDLQNCARDESQGRPNFITVCRNSDGSPNAGAVAMDCAALAIGHDLLELGHTAAQLPDIECLLARAKLADIQEEAFRLGLFPEPEPRAADAVPRLGLIWHSELDEFIDRAGPDVIENTGCPACLHSAANPVFRKQGFLFNRCCSCSHIYVSPRLRPEVQAQLAAELDGTLADPFSQTQKIYADYLCWMLRQKVAGPRLLDIGFGAGFFLQAARAYGFQAYGVETSSSLIEQLQPVLGKRLTQIHVGDTDLPWGSFDLIVMNHVIEHVAEPRSLLTHIGSALNSDGALYLAVPDSESLQFQLFGKHWDAVNPVAHYQFFNERSLTKMLQDCGFEVVTRVRMPPLQGELKQRWMQMFRRLGGDETGELALLARLNRAGSYLAS